MPHAGDRSTRIRDRPRWRIVAACLALVIAGVARAADEPAAPITVAVVRGDTAMQVTAELRAAASAATCFAVIVDFDHLAEFIPGLRVSRVISAPGEPIRLHQTGVAEAGPFEEILDVVLHVTVEAPTRVAFARESGNLRVMQGAWTIGGDATRCHVHYDAAIAPAFWIPPLLGPRLMRGQVERQMQGLLQEIERRGAPGHGAS